MLDESHVSVSLWFRSIGIQNPFDDDTNNSDYNDDAGRDGSHRSFRHNNLNTAGGGGGGGGNLNHHHRGGGDDGNDVLVPPEHASSRQASIGSGAIALAMTLAGSCAMEAPYAFDKCGLVWGTLLFGLLAVSTERALHMLCICARQTGSNSYATLARSSCGGYRALWQTSALEIGLLLLLVVHSTSLLRRMVQLALESFLYGSSNTNSTLDIWVLLGLLTIMTPLFVPKQYHTLRIASALGLIVMALFAMTISILAVLRYYERGDVPQTSSSSSQQDQDQQQYTQLYIFHNPMANSSHKNTTDRTVWDVIEGFQNLLIGFLASFNILPIQRSLKDPTRERMAAVVHYGVVMGAVLTYAVGVAGFFCIKTYSFSNSQDATSDFLDSIEFHANTNGSKSLHLFLYRICHTCGGLVLILGFPLILVPSRYSILELIESIYSERQCPEISDCQEDCETCTTRASTVSNGDNGGNHRNNALVVINERTGAVVNNECTSLLPSIEENPTYDLHSNPLAQGLCTLGILIWAYFGAVSVTLMDAFYMWVGPGLVYVFAFALPSLYFLGLQRPRRFATSNNPEKKSFRLYARILIFFCIGGIIFWIVDIVQHLPKGRWGQE